MLNSMSETKKERSFTPSVSGLVCRLVGEACRGDCLRGAVKGLVHIQTVV